MYIVINKDRIFGIHPVLEALSSDNVRLDKIFIQQGSLTDNIREIINAAKAKKVRTQHVPKEKLNRLCTKNHQGVVAYLSLIDYQDIDQVVPMIYEAGESPLLVALDRVTDVRNLGAIARTAECVGAHAILFPEKGSAAINADAIKTSSGALLNINVCKSNTFEKNIEYCKKSGIQILCASEKADKSVYDIDFRKPTLIVMGSEEDGVSERILKKCDALIKLPILGSTKSLNVSVACGAILYEATRQRLVK